MRALLAGGVFDDEGGRASGYARKLFARLLELLPEGAEAINGGVFSDLEALSRPGPGQVEALLWMADIPNDKPKLVNQLRQSDPSLALVISKNNRSGKYDAAALAERIERAGAAALVEFVDAGDGRVGARVWGPRQERLLESARTPEALAEALAGLLSERGAQ